MPLPGFTAEGSLGKAAFQYWSITTGQRSTEAGVMPQLALGATTPWWWSWWWCPPGCVATGNPWRPCFCRSVGQFTEGPVHVGPGVPVE